jgi:hypothetical protein
MIETLTYIITNDNGNHEIPVSMTSYDECQWKSFERMVEIGEGQAPTVSGAPTHIDDVDAGSKPSGIPEGEIEGEPGGRFDEDKFDEGVFEE